MAKEAKSRPATAAAAGGGGRGGEEAGGYGEGGRGPFWAGRNARARTLTLTHAHTRAPLSKTPQWDELSRVHPLLLLLFYHPVVLLPLFSPALSAVAARVLRHGAPQSARRSARGTGFE